MAATVLSKVLGMLRSVIFTASYGTGVEANAFTEASVIPTTFFDLLLSAAILGCFIPVYNSFSRDKSSEADDFACVFFNTIALLTSALALLGIIFAPQIISFMAPGFDDATKELSVRLLRLMFPMIIFTGGAYTAVGVMQSKGRFLLPAFISSISNGAVIIYLLCFDGLLGEKGIWGLAAVYTLAWLIQLLTLAIPLLRSGFRYRPGIDFHNPALRRALKAVPPVMIGSWLPPVTILSGTFFASFVSFEGSVTVFSSANSLYVMIVGILTYSICNYVFPTLSRLSADGDEESFNDTVRRGTLSSMLIIAPIFAAVLILAGEGVAMLYMRGEFTSEAAAQTATALRGIAVAMPAFSVIEIFSRVMYSKNLNRIPMIASGAGVAVNLLSGFVMIRILGLGIGAVGFSAALGQISAACVLLFSAIRHIKGLFDRDFAIRSLKIAACGLVSAAVMLVLKRVFGADPYSTGFFRSFLTCAAVFLPGALVYMLLGMLLGVIPRRNIKAAQATEDKNK